MDGLVSAAYASTYGSLAVYSTAYPAAAPFLRGWHDSLRAQTDSRFELWVGLDGITPSEVEHHVGGKVEARWIPAGRSESPSALRVRAIDEMAGACDSVLFVDCDDELFPDRVESAKLALAEHDVTACALRIVDEAGRDTGLVFGPPADEDWGEFLPRYNAFGLSNSAYRSELLKRLPPAPVDGPAVDWSLATRAFCSGASLHFDSTPRMAYRQYDANVAKVVPPFSAQDVSRATEVVRGHYRAMLDGGVPMPVEFRGRLEGARERIEDFQNRVVTQPHRLDRYVSNLNAVEPLYVWWWLVANPELERQWRT